LAERARALGRLSKRRAYPGNTYALIVNPVAIWRRAESVAEKARRRVGRSAILDGGDIHRAQESRPALPWAATGEPEEYAALKLGTLGACA